MDTIRDSELHKEWCINHFYPYGMKKVLVC